MTTPTITAIETEYAGHRFRSRLEARWAVFFDHLGIRWAYEPQGFEIHADPWAEKTTRYLPDFWLPDFGLWCEVKGELDHDGMKRIIMAASSAGLPLTPDGEWPLKREQSFPWRPRLLMLGNVPRDGDCWLHSCLSVVAESVIAVSGISFAKARDGSWTLAQLTNYKPLNQFLIGEEPDEKTIRRFVHGEGHAMVRTFAFVEDAYRAARMARFEHGESGAPA